MRDLSTMLWRDLVDDAERIAFLESGRAVETGIIAPVMVPEIIEVFRFLASVQAQQQKYTVDYCGFIKSPDAWCGREVSDE